MGIAARPEKEVKRTIIVNRMDRFLECDGGFPVKDIGPGCRPAGTDTSRKKGENGKTQSRKQGPLFLI